MTDDLDAALAAWAAKHPEIITMIVFGSRARGDVRPDSDLDLAFELDDTRESALTVLVVNREQWQRELSELTGLVVRDLYLWGDPEASGPVKEVYSRAAHDFDPASINLKNLRRVNGYWSYREKPVGERGAATAILEAAGFSVERLVSRADGQDPPDCETTIDGEHAGIEVTELVHLKSLRRSLKGRATWFSWEQQAFAGAVQKIIETKEQDGPRWQGGPYGRRLVVVSTDEPFLNKGIVGRFLEGQRFKTRFFSDAVLGLSYDPSSKSIPTFRLTLDRS